MYPSMRLSVPEHAPSRREARFDLRCAPELTESAAASM
jgi:hypothetical protein